MSVTAMRQMRLPSVASQEHVQSLDMVCEIAVSASRLAIALR